MMAATKALLIFCEGAHDVAFVRQVFKFCFHAELAKGVDGKGLKFSEYPAPFNQLFRTSVEEHAAKDLSLDMAKKFFLPDRTLVKDDWIILLFNAGGAKQISKVKLFLKNFIPLYQEASVFQQDALSTISEAKYLFLYDADHRTPNDIANRMQDRFATINETEWALAPWSIQGTKRGVIQHDKALYVWSGENGKGTLEDILHPIYEISNTEILKQSKEFIEGAFSWNLEWKNEQQKYSTLAKKAKAILCAAGQGQKPGRPLSAIIDDNVLGNKGIIVSAPSVKDFKNFIKRYTSIEESPKKG